MMIMDGQKFLKIILIIIAMIAGKLFSQYFITATHYKTFKSEDGGYRVTIPTQTQSDVKTLNTPAGTVNIYIQMARDKNLGIEFGASYFKLPDAMKSRLQTEGTNDFFENMINGMQQDSGGKILNKQSIQFMSYPGKECEIKVSDDKIIKIKMFIVKNTVYQMIVNCFSEDRDHKKIRDFFNSFELTKI